MDHAAPSEEQGARKHLEGICANAPIPQQRGRVEPLPEPPVPPPVCPAWPLPPDLLSLQHEATATCVGGKKHCPGVPNLVPSRGGRPWGLCGQ